jgi:hypothetical protein
LADDLQVKIGNKDVSEETKKKVRETMMRALERELASDSKAAGAESWFASSSVMGGR